MVQGRVEGAGCRRYTRTQGPRYLVPNCTCVCGWGYCAQVCSMGWPWCTHALARAYLPRGELKKAVDVKAYVCHMRHPTMTRGSSVPLPVGHGDSISETQSAVAQATHCERRGWELPSGGRRTAPRLQQHPALYIACPAFICGRHNVPAVVARDARQTGPQDTSSQCSCSPPQSRLPHASRPPSTGSHLRSPAA